MGFEPQTFRPTVRRANHCATGAGQCWFYTACRVVPFFGDCSKAEGQSSSCSICLTQQFSDAYSEQLNLAALHCGTAASGHESAGCLSAAVLHWPVLHGGAWVLEDGAHKGLTGLCLDVGCPDVASSYVPVSSVFALARTASMCSSNLAALCCSAMPLVLRGSDVLHHFGFWSLYWWLLVVYLRLMVRTLHLPLGWKRMPHSSSGHSSIFWRSACRVSWSSAEAVMKR